MRTLLYVLLACLVVTSIRCKKTSIVEPIPDSPDLNGRIVFALEGSGSSGPDGVWAVDLHGTSVTSRLVAPFGSDVRISQNGGLVVFSKISAQQSQDILVVPVAGGTERDVTNRNQSSDFYPDISFNNSLVLYSALFSSTGATAICQVDTGGNGFRALTDTSNVASQAWFSRFSPDGYQIAYIRRIEPAPSAKYELAVMSADGTVSRDLAETHNLIPPQWSTDGLYIAYESASTSAGGVGIVDVQSGFVKEISVPGLSVDANGCMWTPKGELYCFGRNGNDTLFGVVRFADPMAGAGVFILATFRYQSTLLCTPDGQTVGVLGRSKNEPLALFILGEGEATFTEVGQIASGGEVQLGGFAQWSK